MGHNVFVSYKYKDQNVRQIPGITPFTWGRDYVDVLAVTAGFVSRLLIEEWLIK